MTARPHETEKLTTLPIGAGEHPFALSEHELTLDGDWWAWQFLRRNPFYRRDFELRTDIPELLRGRANRPLLRSIGPPPRLVPEDYGQLDCRYFCAHGQVLSGPAAWPVCEPLSLADYQRQHPDIASADIQIRELDSGTTYGITQWFAPDQVALPPLGLGQSWFYHLTEPLWEVGNLEIQLVEEFYRDDLHGKVVVGFSQEKPFARVGLTRLVAGKAGGDKTEVPASAPPGSLSFASETEFAFLVCLEGEIPSQLRPLKTLAKALHGLAVKNVDATMARDLRCPRPLIFHPNQGLARPLNRLQGQLRGLTRQPHRHRQHWRIVFLDVAVNLEAQFKTLEAQLLNLQSALDKAQGRPLGRIDRKRNASPGDFWLKKSLCLLELQEHLAAQNGGKPPGAEQIAQAILDPSHRLHALARPKGGATAPQLSDGGKFPWNSETYKAALRKGKDFSLGLYEYLVGLASRELRNDRPAPP